MEKVQPAITSGDWSYAAASGGMTTTADAVLRAAQGAGFRNVITGIQLINRHATVATEVVIKDGSTIIWRMELGAVTLTPVDIKFNPPLKASANAALNVACITTGSKVYANAQGFTVSA
jgi:hypothetical protein